MTRKHTSSTNPALPRKTSRENHAPKRSFAERTLDFMKSIGEWRDRALVITGLFYAAGYLIWSWNALQNNLGLLPAFQFQYIVAGIGPVVIGAISIGGGSWFWRLLNNVWLKKVETDSTRIWQRVRFIFQMMVFISIGSMIFFPIQLWH